MADCKMGAVSIFVFLGLFLAASCNDGRRHTRFEYKLSFKGPHLVNKQGNVPFWKHYGSAIAGDEQVRVTPSLKDQKGSMWTKNKNTNEFWEIEVFFKVAGRGRVGGDGLAVWFTEEPGNTGPVFGSNDNWKGMGLFFDSFDNDGEQNNPYVMVIMNDGTKSYNHPGDGFNQQLGGCMRDFRNRPNPVRAKVRYFNGILTVFYHNGMSTKDDDYELCMRAENVQMPKEGYFGISAATGGLADDHDVLKFSTYSLKQPTKEEKKPEKTISEDERKKLEQQYDQYAQQLEKEKETFKTQHPEKFRPEEGKYENGYDRDVRLIYEGQSSIHQLVGTLHGKTGELTTQINNLHNAVAKIQSGGSMSSSGGSGAAGITRQELNALVSVQNEVKNSVNNLRMSVDNIQLGGSHNPKMDEIHANMMTVLEQVGHLATRSQLSGGGAQQKKKDCPTVNCIGPKYFVLFIFIQIAATFGFIWYKNQQDQASKKFY